MEVTKYLVLYIPHFPPYQTWSTDSFIQLSFCAMNTVDSQQRSCGKNVQPVRIGIYIVSTMVHEWWPLNFVKTFISYQNSKVHII